MEKKLYKVFYRTGNGNESFTFIEADGEETINKYIEALYKYLETTPEAGTIDYFTMDI